MSVIALAGRRIDAAGATSSGLPLANVELVSARVRDLLTERQATVLVCSAACGADLIALAVAIDRKIRCRVVLPFDAVRFRQTSVVDRPGAWGLLFDLLMPKVAAVGEIVTLKGAATDSEAYVAANLRILDDAQAIARKNGADVTAVLVWDGGGGRSEIDLTEQFGQDARSRGLPVVEVLTV